MSAAGPALADAARFLPPGFAEWRAAARTYLRAGLRPEQVAWTEPQLGLDRPLLAGGAAQAGRDASAPHVPRAFLRIAAAVACHRDPDRWDLLYRVLWRLAHGERALLRVATDPDVHRLMVLHKAVRRATHKMKAFVRFRRVEHPASAGAPDADRYVAWFEPAHRVVERTAPFFVRRFAGMRWSILTPDACAHWDGREVTFTPGVPASQAPRADELEDLWRDYYASVFNPARLATGVMRAEMPKSYWKNLPEARLIADLARDAPARVARMIESLSSPPEPIPAELRSTMPAPSSPPPDARARAAAIASSSVRPAPLDFPPWHPVHDPGEIVARERELALPEGSGKAIRLGDVTVMPGVAGWTDPTLLAPGVFYPPEATTPELRLRYYASRFDMVEVDSTYYSLPRREHAVAWVERTPPGFRFYIKAHALMTGHATDVRRLPDWLRRKLPRHLAGTPRLYGRDLPEALHGELWERYLAALEPLVRARKLGAIFLQFPRWFEPGEPAERVLRDAARRLGRVIGAVEFRNPAWVATPERAARTFGLLEDSELAYTVVDAPPGTRSSMPPIVRATRRDFAVVRLHGRRVETWEARNAFVTERYRYLYSRTQVAEWAERVVELTAMIGNAVLPIAYNNNHANYATTNAAEMGEIIRSERTRRAR